MKRTTIALALSFVLLASASCNQSREQEVSMPEMDYAVSENKDSNVAPKSIRLKGSDAAAAASVAPAENTIERSQSVNKPKIIREGNISIESKDVKTSKKNLDQQLKQMGGYYERESANTDNNNLISYDLVLRIPSDKLDGFLTSVENGKDKITSKSLTSEDVSLQYYDLESRLKSKRAYLERYQAMVSSAKNVKELLEIQEQIRQLQEEIDSSESVMRNLSGQVNYSSLRINLFDYQSNLPMGSNSFWSRVKSSFGFGGDLVANIVLGIIGLWPIFIIGSLVVFVVLRWRNRRKVRFQSRNQSL